MAPICRIYTSIGLSILLAALLALGGCATSAPEKKKSTVDDAQLIWPRPPEQPRIRFVGTISLLESADEKKSFRDVLLGEEETEGATSLVKPYGVASDSNGRIFVADTQVPGLPVFDTNSGTVERWGLEGLGALSKPVGVAVDPAGPVYVSDRLGMRVVMFDTNGKYLNAFGGEEELPGPAGLAFNALNERLYVADSKRHQVLVYRRDGTLDFVIGERGAGDAQFNFPTNLAVDRNGRVYVADSMNFRIQVLEADGRYVTSVGSIGDNKGNFSRLRGIGVDSEGHIYGADAAFNNFQIFNEQGQLLLYVGTMGVEHGQFYMPAGMFIDRNDRIYVADQFNNRIQIFQYLAEEEAD